MELKANPDAVTEVVVKPIKKSVGSHGYIPREL